jgi:hypothetical protein
MALGSTQPLKEMSARNGAYRCPMLGITHYHIYMPSDLKSGSHKFLEYSGLLRNSASSICCIYVYTRSVHVKFVRHNVKNSHRRHVRKRSNSTQHFAARTAEC